jgi:predicted DNA-binding transcriptional regulator AlpA
MSTVESAASVLRMPSSAAVTEGVRPIGRPRRLLSVDEVAEWLGVSKGWVRDHAAGRRQPRLQAIKLGPSKSKGLWKFREEDILEFIEARSRDGRLR